MRRPIVTRYEPDPALSWERQRAVDAAFRVLDTDAAIFRAEGDVFSARRCAHECRAPIKAFGVRLMQRREISVARQEQIMAEIRAARARTTPKVAS